MGSIWCCTRRQFLETASLALDTAHVVLEETGPVAADAIVSNLRDIVSKSLENLVEQEGKND